jgi:DNA polymerase III epsilon subunit-like protein
MLLNEPITNLNILALDFETSGAVKNYDEKPIQIGVAIMRAGQISPAECWQSNLHLPKEHPINPFAQSIHRLHHEDLVNAPTIYDIWPKLLTTLQNIHCLSAHNIPCERKVLHRTFPLHTFGPWLDTLKISRHYRLCPHGNCLADVLHHQGLYQEAINLSQGRSAHDALFDAIGCLLLLQKAAALHGPDIFQHIDYRTR